MHLIGSSVVSLKNVIISLILLQLFARVVNLLLSVLLAFYFSISSILGLLLLLSLKRLFFECVLAARSVFVFDPSNVCTAFGTISTDIACAWVRCVCSLHLTASPVMSLTFVSIAWFSRRADAVCCRRMSDRADLGTSY